MRVRFKIVLFCSIFFSTVLYGQDTGWTLPTPDSNKLPTALIPYPDEVIRQKDVSAFLH